MVSIKKTADHEVGFLGAAMVRAPGEAFQVRFGRHDVRYSEAFAVIASVAKQSRAALDCFVTSFLAMTKAMRPEILNPLFTEVEALKGVGPQLAKLLKKLDLTRVVDLLYHLPTGSIERVLAPARRRRCSAATSSST